MRQLTMQKTAIKLTSLFKSNLETVIVRANLHENGIVVEQPTGMIIPIPFCYFKTSPEIIRLAVMMYIRFTLSLRNAEGLLHERGIDISHEFAVNNLSQFIDKEAKRGP
jgi:hypothetical protein